VVRIQIFDAQYHTECQEWLRLKTSSRLRAKIFKILVGFQILVPYLKMNKEGREVQKVVTLSIESD
jgi:hypothetical protein